MTQPPANKDATEHVPLVSETLKEHAAANQAEAERTRQQTARMEETEERMHRRLDTNQPRA